MFESIPALSDNTKPVYDEFVRRGFQKKYRLLWYLENNTYAELEKGKTVYYQRKSLKQKIRYYSFFYNTVAIICCNRFFSPEDYPLKAKHSKYIYLSHGIPIKSLTGYYRAPQSIDYALSPGKAVTSLLAKEFSIDASKFFVAGFPRNDVLSDTRKKVRLEEFGDAKVIIWYPTLRQHKNKVICSKGNALPLIHEESSIKKLNETAREHNTVILFKPHFSQDTSDMQALDLSNILFIDETFFEKKRITSYELLAGSDALITDYSSVYYDYTLCDKPIAVVWEDFEEYKEFPGFAIDVDTYMKGAVKIFTIEDLCGFVTDVAMGIDRCQTQRREIRDLANDYTDGRNAERTVDFIVDKANL